MSAFQLRAWKISDLDQLVKYANDRDIARYLMDVFPHPYSHDDGMKFIAMASQANPSNILAIEVKGKACGSIGLHLQSDIYRKNAELGYWLAKPYHNQGIMTNAVKQMVKYGFSTFPVDRIYARPFSNNTASQKVLEKAGFTMEARLEKTLCKNGEMLDELIYAVRRPA